MESRYDNMERALGEETIAADLLRDENLNLKNEIDNLKRIMTEEPKTIDHLIQEKVDEAVLQVTDDLPDEERTRNIVDDMVYDKIEELKDGLVDKVIKAIVERLEY